MIGCTLCNRPSIRDITNLIPYVGGESIVNNGQVYCCWTELELNQLLQGIYRLKYLTWISLITFTFFGSLPRHSLN